jgi:hypothetical protein
MNQDQAVEAAFEAARSGLNGQWSGTVTTTSPGCVWNPSPIFWQLTQSGSALTGQFRFNETLSSGGDLCASHLFSSIRFQVQ